MLQETIERLGEMATWLNASRWMKHSAYLKALRLYELKNIDGGEGRCGQLVA